MITDQYVTVDEATCRRIADAFTEAAAHQNAASASVSWQSNTVAMRS
ncbi:MAG: hypothetical protein WBA97_11070 [Actinophytocola sp.]